ncbi:MAG: hypothetical protein JXN65_02030 [Clostridia bacterium]|nr:hypothetical protein [Clostridia bacterium]
MEEKIINVEEQEEEKIKLKPGFWFGLFAVVTFFVMLICKSVVLKSLTFAGMQEDYSAYRDMLNMVGILDVIRALCMAALIIYGLVKFVKFSKTKTDPLPQEKIQIGLVTFGLILALMGPIAIISQSNEDYFEGGYRNTLIFNTKREISSSITEAGGENGEIILGDAVPFEWDKVYVVSSAFKSSDLADYVEGRVYNELKYQVGDMSLYFSPSNATSTLYFFYNSELIFEYDFSFLEIYDSADDLTSGIIYFKEFTKDTAVFYMYEDESRVWIVQKDN